MANILELLPAIASFLLGPAGGIAAAGVQFLAEKLGAKEETVDGIRTALANYTPEQLNEARRIDIEFQKFCLDNGIKLQLAQIEVNKQEAMSSSLFVAGWRPYVGWVCGFALTYAAILEPLMRFAATVLFSYSGDFPVLDTMLTLQTLFGILGLGAYRTYEKTNGGNKK